MKIIEAYSSKNVIDVEVIFSCILNISTESGICRPSRIKLEPVKFQLTTRPYINKNKLDERILKFKLDNIDTNENSALIIIKNGKLNLATR